MRIPVRRVAEAGKPLRRGLAGAVLLIGTTQAASAQWSQADTLDAVTAFNNAFYFDPSGDDYDYRSEQGSRTPLGFWESAETIELAEDAFTNDPTAAKRTIVAQLCNGFVARYTADWSSDTFDDDLMWATIAFTRAYVITGDPALLRDARDNFSLVWSRGFDATYGGGIWENVATANTPKGTKTSAANWTFVIAGNALSWLTGDATYRSEARTVYDWAVGALYDAGTGVVADHVGATGPVGWQFSYNYGTFVGASVFEGDDAQAGVAAAHYAGEKTGGVVDGYNIMPSYAGTDGDADGFNGIALRWIGLALRIGAIRNPAVLGWAQANVSHAWSLRDAAGLSWQDWTATTPPSGALAAWNCSDTVAGMLDVPAPTAAGARR